RFSATRSWEDALRVLRRSNSACRPDRSFERRILSASTFCDSDAVLPTDASFSYLASLEDHETSNYMGLIAMHHSREGLDSHETRAARCSAIDHSPCRFHGAEDAHQILFL